MSSIVESLYRLAETNLPNGEELLLSDDLKNHLITEYQANFNFTSECVEVSKSVKDFLESKGISGVDIYDNFSLISIFNSEDNSSENRRDLDNSLCGTGEHTMIRYKDKLYDFTSQQYSKDGESPSNRYPESFKDILPVVFTKVNGHNNLYEATSDSGDVLLAGDLIDNIKQGKGK